MAHQSGRNGSVDKGGDVAGYVDIKAITHKMKIYDSEVEVTTIHTSKTVFEAYGDYNGVSVSAKAGSRPAALARWRHLAKKTED